MRFIKAIFRNLIGIYNKSGVDYVEIDFTKCKHDLIYITGPNGSGKSTLMDVLHPLPDSASMYITGKEGYKKIEYYNDGERYIINIVYPIGANGNRLQTKAYIQINIDGEWKELNPNGNIGTYKDLIYNKFGLDSNYLSLSKLSIENRGIVDKKPSERKKYVADILEYTEAYNDIYKALVKRSSIYKSLINTITAKIDNIGSFEKLTMDIQATNSLIDSLTATRAEYSNSLSLAKSTIYLHDKDGQLQSKYNELKSKNDNLDQRLVILRQAISKEPIYASLESAIECSYKYDKMITELEIKKAALQEKIQYLYQTKEEDARLVTIKSAKIANMQSEYDYVSLKKMIAKSSKKVMDMDTIIKQVGYTGVFDISKAEYILGLQTLKSLREAALNVRSYASDMDIQQALVYLENGSFDINSYNNLIEELETVKAEKLKEIEQFQYYKGLTTQLDILSNRPSDCKIESCAFIKNAIEIKKKNPEHKMEQAQSNIDILMAKEIDLEKQIQSLTTVKEIYESLFHIVRSIDTNKQILNKLPNGSIFTNTKEFIDRLRRGDTFNDINDLYVYIRYANIFDEYKIENEKLQSLKHQLSLIQHKADIIEELEQEIKNIQKKLDDSQNTISLYNGQIKDISKNIVDISNKKSDVDNKIKILEEIKELSKEQAEVQESIQVMNSSIQKIAESIAVENDLTTKIMNIDKDLAPLITNRDKCKFALAQLDDYNKELQEYTEQYNLIEVCKKYSSPTKGGIQLLFMKLYMDKTLQLSNQLLEYFFEGQLKLLPYQINDSEFRIPCTNKITNMVNDDISSCSTAERFMISMIMSFAMKFQSSSTYNIISLDEFNGTLDANNKMTFPLVLEKIRKILNIEQCLIISQTLEQELTKLDADVISLWPRDQINNISQKANVIYQL